MKFEYHVASQLEAERMMREGWPSHTISALGAQHAYEVTAPNHLMIVFDDTEVIDPTGKWVAVTREDVERVLDFTKALAEGDRLLIHCRAGKSRSTALLMGILMMHGMEAHDAFTAVLNIRPVAIPNRRIVDLIDEILETGGTLTECVAAYYKTLMIPGVHLPDRGGANL